MERLKAGIQDKYDSIEASIHIGRYALALPFASGRRVLDVASGEGYGSWLLANAGAAEVVGIDVSVDAIEKARTNFNHDGLRFEISNGENISDLLPIGYFDLIVSIETIEHVSDVEAFLQEIRIISAPNAIILITCPNDNWYYGEAAGNPYHLRRFDLEGFKAITTGVLGNNVEWMLGSASLGFASLPLKHIQRTNHKKSKYIDIYKSNMSLRVPSNPSDPPSQSNCGYFVGLWNAPPDFEGAGAYHVLSMDEYSRMIWAGHSADDLALAHAEREDQLRELETVKAELAAFADEASVERREREIVGVQAAALRRENEIISSQLLTLKASLDAEKQDTFRLNLMLSEVTTNLSHSTLRVNELDEALAWHVSRVGSLDEALAWHVSRIENLEAEKEETLRLHVILSEITANLSQSNLRVHELEEALAWHVSRIEHLEEEAEAGLIRSALRRFLRDFPMLGRLSVWIRSRRNGG
jgi:SAM-dependent methyltransferase